MKKVKIYRSCFILFFLLLYSVSILKTYIPYVNYYVNYTYISENLCENKDKPEMECNGKCHLEKTIKEAETENTKEKSTPTLIKVINFQEMPLQTLRLKSTYIVSVTCKKNSVATRYNSPSLDIVSPPPQI